MTSPSIVVGTATPPGSPVSTAFIATGVTGATAPSRYAGGTTSGAPVTGSFAVGDFVIDETGKVWICTAAGTPGTWTNAGGVTGTIPISGGGTGQVTQQAALDALAGAVTAAEVLAGTGSHVTLRSLAAADLPAATTSAQGAVILDGTAGDFQPVPGVAAAGAIGKAADSGHVHPWKPWQFHVAAYGAKGNGVMVIDGAMSASSPNLACATSVPFTAGSVGDVIVVMGAGVSDFGSSTNAGRPLVTTIKTFTNSGHVVLNASSTNACSGAGVVFGADDTAAVQSAINAAYAYAAANGGYAEVLFDPVYYIIAGAPVIGGATLGNSQITLPVNPESSNTKKTTLVLKGLPESGAPCPQFLDTAATPFVPGAVLCSIVAPGTLDVTYGPACVIGGPWSGYGGGGGTFTNSQVIVDGINIQPVYVINDPGLGAPSHGAGPVVGGINLYGIGAAWVRNYSFIPLAIDLAGTSWPQWLYPNSWSGTQWQPGLIMPASGNNDQADIDRYTCFGAWAGVVGSEHCTFDVVRVLQSGPALIAQNPSSVAHGLAGRYLSVESCVYAVAVYNSGTYASSGPIGVQILQADFESNGTSVYDPGSFLRGGMNFQDNDATGYLSNQFAGSPSSINFRLVQQIVPPGPVSSPQAPPGSGTAWANYYYRDAWITVGGSVSALLIDSTAQHIPSGSVSSLMLPSGHSYTPTYSGTISHAVTLL